MWIFWSLLLFFSSVATQQNRCTQKHKNDIGDYLIWNLIENYPDGVLVDDISSHGAFGNKIEASYGVMRSMKTLKRVGDVYVDNENDMLININITFGDLVVNYEKYQFTALGFIGMSYGSMSAKAYENLIEIQAQISEKSMCYININDVIIHKLEDFRVQMKSGCALCGKISTSVGNNVLRFYKDKIRFDVHTRLINALPKIIRPNRYICRHLKDNY